ncbi:MULTISPECIES: ankyrin repeat domain-containing protein [unclassified Oceanispirochaeta]|uniref:ankyrin repeat domain-containing protein n=1 Tax=unclassified Oceanispirochaeta TaxID=2635722 RepID=UPI000E08DB2A|nr:MULTISPECIES: ankyrin repeat domain-containing protein [unclassified Oceanispirochaeta]MBF9017678.1 ankyrin repeat domain-containing protein [Oceanispirochaeta sp. M2]NPD74250.1 ankyrin repeat domain-containing protein [Oceanispirochaeta sp. M1]RDG29956.1 ankyrin repeat domain-containing protein [Oceanispirochaeta sp. M1]
MKFSVFCSEKNKTELPHLRIAFDEFFIEYQTLLFSEKTTLEDSMPALKQVLSSTSFYLLIPDNEDFSKQWLSFVVGYSQLVHENIIIYAPGGCAPSWLNDFIICLDFKTLINTIKERMPLWNKQLKENQALDTLEDKMKEHNHQNFAKAIEDGDRFLTGVFLEAGYEVNKLSSDQVSLMALAARHGYRSIAEILFDAGADINIISLDRNNTPLMDAASEGHEDLVQFFIDKGASLDIKSKSGQTALVLATGNGHTGCAEILIEAGADCDQEDSMGLSARKYARLYQKNTILDKMPPASE